MAFEPRRTTMPRKSAPLLDGHQRGSRPEIVRFLREKVPAQDGQLASHRHGGDLVATPSPNADEERVKRSGRLRGSPGGLHQHRARMAASDLADAAVLGETKPGLTNTRVQPDIAHELLRRGTDEMDKPFVSRRAIFRRRGRPRGEERGVGWKLRQAA